jgi:hypothetical protein
MEDDEVILEAYGLLRTITAHTHGQDLYPSTPRVYDPAEAINGVQRRYPDDPFWESVDRPQLLRKLETYADSKLREQGTSLQQLMDERATRCRTMAAI